MNYVGSSRSRTSSGGDRSTVAPTPWGEVVLANGMRQGAMLVLKLSELELLNFVSFSTVIVVQTII